MIATHCDQCCFKDRNCAPELFTPPRGSIFTTLPSETSKRNFRPQRILAKAYSVSDQPYNLLTDLHLFTMCKYTQRDYLCRQTEWVGADICPVGHAQFYAEIWCDQARAANRPCPYVPPAAMKDTAWRCYDPPGCCERFLWAAFTTWAKYRADVLAGGYDERSEELGEEVRKVFHEHARRCGLTQDIWADLRKEALANYSLPDRRLHRHWRW